MAIYKAIRPVLRETKFYMRQFEARGSVQYVIAWDGGPSEDAVQSLAQPCVHHVPFASVCCERRDAPDVCEPEDAEMRP